MNNQEFIDYLSSKSYPVLKSLAIAQACLESQYGRKHFYNNYLGIKCHNPNLYAGCRLGKTKEFIDGSYKDYKLAFQTYNNIDECIEDYSQIMNLPRYKPVREAINYIEATEEVRYCGYATSITYVQSLRKIIEKYKLYELDFKMNPNDKLARNFIFKESWSTKVVNGFEYERRIPPTKKYIPLIFKGAANLQKIRDRLNICFGSNSKIGRRNKLGEIVLDVASWWRTGIFQRYLKLKGQSTTSTGNHPKGIAIDLYTPRGMTPNQFRDFIRDQCDTDFTYFIVYRWGIHCDWRKC